MEPRSSLSAASAVGGAGTVGRRHCSNSAATTGDKTANETSDWYISGGSSGGSAVAVAAGVVLAYVLFAYSKYR